MEALGLEPAPSFPESLVPASHCPSSVHLHTPCPLIVTPACPSSLCGVLPSTLRTWAVPAAPAWTHTATLCPSGRYPGSRRAGALSPRTPAASPGCATCTR